MSTGIEPSPHTTQVDPSPGLVPSATRRRFRLPGSVDLGVDRLSGIYVAVVLIVIFSILEPQTFATLNNASIIASSEAITGILTLGLIVSLLAGMFDVSVAANMSLALTLVAWLQSAHHVNALAAVVLTLLSGAAVGVANALVITRLHVQPVIATLAMSSILAAIAFWIGQGQDIITGISPNFDRFGQSKFVGMPVSVCYLLGIAVVLWYLLEHTATGRYLYAVGANAEAAELVGLKVVRLQWTALIIAGVLSSFAGILLTMQLGSSSYDAGTPYLLPAFAVAFLGSTQIKPGRFNVVGTLVALYLLAIGVKGLQLRYPSLPWIMDLFEGLALIAAVAIGARSQLRRTRR
jgi:ribose transport system permease protein